jgi:hypothetical protein
MKSDVLTDSMPTKKWVEVPCALTDTQRELYIDILEKNYSKLNGAIRNGQCNTCSCLPPLFIVVLATFTSLLLSLLLYNVLVHSCFI